MAQSGGPDRDLERTSRRSDRMEIGRGGAVPDVERRFWPCCWGTTRSPRRRLLAAGREGAREDKCRRRGPCRTRE